MGGASGLLNAAGSARSAEKSKPTCKLELDKLSSAIRAVLIGTSLSRGCCRITIRVRVSTGLTAAQ
jgi:hypothetical protein